MRIEVYGYQIHASGEVLSSQTGSNMPHKEKTIQAIQRKLANYLPLKLKAGEKATFYIKNEYTGFRNRTKGCSTYRNAAECSIQPNKRKGGIKNFFLMDFFSSHF